MMNSRLDLLRSHYRSIFTAYFDARILLVAIVLGLGGCGGGNKKESIVKPKPPLKIRTVSFSMGFSANNNWPVAVELIRVRDADIAQSLLDIKPKDWFAEERDNFRNANPNAYFDSWEVVPGTNFGPIKAKVRGRVAGVLLCDTEKSNAPLRVFQNGNVLINITDEGCSVQKYRRGRKKEDTGRSPVHNLESVNSN